MTSRMVTILVVLILGYFLGVKFPALAAKVGLA
jgi:hypothetical protein